MRIFVVSDSPYLYTGLARVSRNVIRCLAEAGHEVIVGGWGWDQLAYPLNDNSQWSYVDIQTGNEYLAFPLPKDKEKLLLFTYEVMRQVKCDAVFTIGDYWDFDGFHLLKQKLDYGFKWITYYTIESEPINEKYRSVFGYMDIVLSPSKYGKKIIEDSTGCECLYAPYGIDHNSFYPLGAETINAERKKRGLEGKFRFINVSKNQHRKNLPAFMEALKLAHDQNKDIVGYLHTNAEKKVPMQVDLLCLQKRFGLDGILEFPDKKLSIDIGFSDAQLNIEYNCSNALVVTSVAEGFCLPLVEAQSCGLPVVATRCSTIPELTLDHEFLVSASKYFTALEHEVRIANVEDLAEKMVKASCFDHNKERYSDFAKGFFWDRMNSIIAKALEERGDRIRVSADSI